MREKSEISIDYCKLLLKNKGYLYHSLKMMRYSKNSIKCEIKAKDSNGNLKNFTFDNNLYDLYNYELGLSLGE